MTAANPWGLTPAQARAMDAVIEHDCQKIAARVLGLAPTTVRDHISAARRIMGVHRGHSRHLILWDRWRRPKGEPS